MSSENSVPVDVEIEAVRASHRYAKEDDDDHEIESKELSLVHLQLKILKEFASGNFSRVYLAQMESPERRRVAIKKLNMMPDVKSREISILRSLNHPNTIKLLYYYTTDGALYKEMNLVLEFLPETLYQVRKNSPIHLPMALITKYIWQLLCAVQYIHSQHICHRDIKPTNILVDKTTHVLKLADFGSAKMMKETDRHGSIAYIVSRHYRAPELLLGNKRYSVQIDIWSCGCVLGELIQKSILFPGENQNEQMGLIVSMLGNPTVNDMEVLRPGYVARAGLCQIRIPSTKELEGKVWR